MNLPDPLEYLRRLWRTKPPTDEPPTCPECGDRMAISWTADDPPISFTMHRCEGVQK